MPTLDDTDRDIIMRRGHKYNGDRRDARPDIGDYVEFSDGIVHRVSHVWGDGVQTSKGGSFYLGEGYMAFSGGLEPSIPYSDLTDTGEMRNGGIWIFHHNYATAGGGVNGEIPFKVYRADRPTHERWCMSCGRMVPGAHEMGADGRHKSPRTPVAAPSAGE